MHGGSLLNLVAGLCFIYLNKFSKVEIQICVIKLKNKVTCTTKQCKMRC